MKKEIVLLGDQALYQISKEVDRETTNRKELDEIENDLHDTLLAYRNRYGAGRAVAAPQIGTPKRILYMFVNEPILFINPQITFPDKEQMIVMDDCMSFPGLYVMVMRYKRCTVDYYDKDWNACVREFEGDLSELIQHEYDHLDGILATMRAIDQKSFHFKCM